jgi:hypothetical protein
MAKRKNLQVHDWVEIKENTGAAYAGKKGIILSLDSGWAEQSVIVALAFKNQVRRLTFAPSELKRLS